ncbi:hypothetical protein Ae263Ps1_5902c [Pseudonocardia sp. Ae263_Ps1]|nr:hypothetical protein Ae150APs1_5420 [Pseudonocardia sp. Ae150A_Ps1]OLL88847.1 hypothetical protein Ae263Ps1_5902c [Pseudonocardia sp. Ae263_Ps1]OLL91127.1 hypothetical protein Ae356Ps1_1024 [Pseudonocardia sp. Ae356_Ps1]
MVGRGNPSRHRARHGRPPHRRRGGPAAGPARPAGSGWRASTPPAASPSSG